MLVLIPGAAPSEVSAAAAAAAAASFAARATAAAAARATAAAAGRANLGGIYSKHCPIGSYGAFSPTTNLASTVASILASTLASTLASSAASNMASSGGATGAATGASSAAAAAVAVADRATLLGQQAWNRGPCGTHKIPLSVGQSHNSTHHVVPCQPCSSAFHSVCGLDSQVDSSGCWASGFHVVCSCQFDSLSRRQVLTSLWRKVF